jgi:hypothetical protein
MKKKDEDDFLMMEFNMFEGMVDSEIERLSNSTTRALVFFEGVLQARFMMHYMVHKFGEVRVPADCDYQANLPICQYTDKNTDEIVFKAVSESDLKKPN